MVDNCGNKYFHNGSHSNSGGGSYAQISNNNTVEIKYTQPLSDQLIDYIKTILCDPPETHSGGRDHKSYWIRSWRELDCDIIMDIHTKMYAIYEEKYIKYENIIENRDTIIQNQNEELMDLRNKLKEKDAEISAKNSYIESLIQKVINQSCCKKHCKIQ